MPESKKRRESAKTLALFLIKEKPDSGTNGVNFFKKMPTNKISQLEKIRLLAATARLANLPSVWINVTFLSACLSFICNHFTPIILFFELGIASLLYISANFLNDWYDLKWDQRHRPERALPRGIFSPALYFSIAITGLILALHLAWIHSLDSLYVCLFIVSNIVIYTITHKKNAWSVIPMALCRASLIILGATIYASSVSLKWILMSPLILLTIPIFCYIIGLSLKARAQSSQKEKLIPLCDTLIFLSPVFLTLLALFKLVFSDNSPSILWKLGAVATPSIIYLCAWKYWKSRGIRQILAEIPIIECLFAINITTFYLLSTVPINRLELTDFSFFSAPFLAIGAAYLLQKFAPAT